MADDKKQAAETGQESQSAEEAPTYHVDRLISEASDFLGVPSHVAAGALSGESKKNFTREEAGRLVKGWLKREVELDNPQAGDPGREEG